MGSNLVSSFKQKGASIVEALIALPIALGVILGSWQAARLYETKVTLDHASVTAARSGALHNADVNAIKLGLARGLIPLYATGNSDGAVINALAKISENLVTNSSVRILNPTKEAFTDFAENVKGIRQIPNEDLYKRSTAIGKTSKINIQDANLLSIHIIYAVKPEAPFIGPAISSIVRSPLFISAVDNDLKPFYLRGLIPITSSTIVRMQTPARQNGAMLSNNDLNVDRSLTGTKERLVPADLTPINPPEDNNNSNNNSGNGNDQDSSDSSADGSHNSNDGSNSSGNNSNNNTDDQANLTDQDSSADEVECTTKWSDERYAAQECGDGFWCKYVGEWTSQVKRAANVVMDFVGGLMEGMKDQITDLWNLLQDPSVLLDVAKAFIKDPEGTLKSILEGVVDDIETVLSCGPTDIGKKIGQNVDPVIFVKVAQKLAKVVKNDSLIKYAEKVEADTKKLDEDNTISCSSFPAGTLISTPLGSKPIENIQLGDVVNSRDESTFLNTTNRVMVLFNREAPDYQHITTETGSINATPEHPFWVQGRGWIQAKDLKKEDVIASEYADELIIENEVKHKSTHVYNFKVENTSNYFSGNTKAWVHNTNCDIKYETSNGKNSALNKPSPNTVYYVDGRHSYATDQLGRTTKVTSTITSDGLEAGIRNAYQQGKVGKTGIPGDEGGHLIATQLGGPGEKINLVPQNMNLNRSAWKVMENDWAKRAANGQTIKIEIEIIYSDINKSRPETFVVRQWFDDVPQKVREFSNQAGG